MDADEREKLLNEILEQKKKEDELNRFKKELSPGIIDNQLQVRGGMYGWTCPRCGRGLAPFASSCPCVPLPIPDVTCGIIGL